MKKLITASLLIISIVGLLFSTNYFLNKSENDKIANSGQNVLNLYNWGDYIDPALLKKFTDQTGYKVNYETFDSNEAMYTKIKQGGNNYDLTIPSEYMIEKLKSEDLLMPLDHSKLTGLDNFDSRFMNKPFDPGNQYSVPYFWGTLGIVYNDQYIKEGEIQHWDDLWKNQYQDSIMLIDSARDVLGFTLISMGKSVNSKSEADLAAAQGKLTTLMPNVKAIIADEIKMYMGQSEAKIAVTYSGEAAAAIEQNSHLHYVVPSEGSNLWFDNIVIPKTAKNIDAAYSFINFMSEPENAAQNALYIGYATPNAKAIELLPAEIKNDRQFYPDDATIERLQIYQNLGPKWTQKYNDIFLEFKMTRR